MTRGLKVIAGHALLTTGLVLACALALKFATTPFGWIGLAGFILCLQFCLLPLPGAVRSCALTLAFVALPLALAEFALGWMAAGPETIYRPTGSMYEEKPVLGYGPRPATEVQATRRLGERTIFDVNYTIDKNALRTTPGAAGEDTKAPCLFFFGGSFTFGEGVADDETTPAYVAQISSRDFRIYNFGFVGYGPHQMLAALEHGLVRDIAGECLSVHAIYTGIAQHVGRVAGHSPWDRQGPWYRLVEGDAKFAGYFDERGSAVLSRISVEMRKSNMVRLLTGSRLLGPYTDNEIDLYAAVVANSRDRLRQHYGATAEYSVLLWHPDFFGEDLASFNHILEALESRGMDTLVVDSQVLPGPDITAYRIDPHEQHPNPIAQRKVAQFLVNQLGL